MELHKDMLIEMYRRMVQIQLFETCLPHYFDAGYIPGSGHVSMGEEAVAVGACTALNADDYVLSSHRGHGHALAKGTDMSIMLAEIFGRAPGCTGGKGGSMHVSDFSHNFLGTSGITAANINTAVGVGLAIKMCRGKQVCVVFFGDGASNRGTFHEGLNLSSLWKLPNIFICTNNQYALSLRQIESCANPDISARSVAYNMFGSRIDGTDVFSVYDTVEEAVNKARNGEGPSLIECVTYRLSPEHSLRMSPAPDRKYRPDGEVEEWWEKHDPVKIFKQKLLEVGYLSPDIAQEIEDDAQKRFDEAVDFAMKSPEPTFESAFQNIYASDGGE